jgi:hypothetical protein
MIPTILKTDQHQRHKRTKRTNTYLRYDTQNIKNWATRTLQKAKEQTRTYNMIRRILKTEQHQHYKRNNTYLQYDTQNIKNWATWTPQKDEKDKTRTYNMIRRILQTEQHEHHKRAKDKHVPTIWYAEYKNLSNTNTTKGQRTNTYL